MDGKAINSCMVPVMRATGSVIQTIEGVEKNGKLHVIQEEVYGRREQSSVVTVPPV